MANQFVIQTSEGLGENDKNVISKQQSLLKLSDKSKIVVQQLVHNVLETNNIIITYNDGQKLQQLIENDVLKSMYKASNGTLHNIDNNNSNNESF